MNNYHTHTYRCHHASGDIADYVAQAREAGISELGFSDHCPHPDGRWSDTRMDMADMRPYVEALRAAKLDSEGSQDAATTKRKPQDSGNARGLKIFSGLECEWVPEFESFMRDEFLGTFGLDYLVAGIHNYLHRGEWRDTYTISSAAELASFAWTSCKAMESGLFSFLAHPDVFCYHWMPWDENARACARDILEAAQHTGTTLEINGYGMRKPRVRTEHGNRSPYPHEAFWEMASDYRIECVINSDAHRPIDTAANLEDGLVLARKYNIPVRESLFF